MRNYPSITANEAYFRRLVNTIEETATIPSELYEQYDIKRGLRNANGSGVLVGITHIASVVGYKQEDGKKIPAHGELLYRGIPLRSIVSGFQSQSRLGFEEVVFLLMFGELPTPKELLDFHILLDSMRDLPLQYKEDVILKIPSRDIMNKLQRNILCLYSYDDNPDDTDMRNVLLQSLQIISKFPLIVAYCFQAKRHYLDKKSLVLHQPIGGLSTSETLLSLIREDSYYTKEEAELLDLLLVVHAEHGGGNNSAFATHVVSSSGTDTYSAIATALGSLKGPKHGGAALKVFAMFQDAFNRIRDLNDEGATRDYIRRLINKEAYDRSGLVYGLGHAVYTLSDPRAILLKEKAKELAYQKGSPYKERLDFLIRFEELAGEELKAALNTEYTLGANVDFYSGFVYDMLGFPKELFTPLFATSRMAGWCAHRLEQLTDSRIIRPGYVTIGERREYIQPEKRRGLGS
ncbi:MAG: citrate synthase [Tissierellia bacterium]|nr:citrate synthase [Tissierellia bacterium]